MLWVSRDLLSATHDLLEQHLPNEAVGVWLGKRGRTVQVVGLQNLHPTPTVAYEADPLALYRILKEAELSGLELVALFHSHPRDSAIPSESDRAQAFWRVPYVIVAMQTRETRAWKLPEIEEVPIIVE